MLKVFCCTLKGFFAIGLDRSGMKWFGVMCGIQFTTLGGGGGLCFKALVLFSNLPSFTVIRGPLHHARGA